jgi:hypothetical protein
MAREISLQTLASVLLVQCPDRHAGRGSRRVLDKNLKEYSNRTIVAMPFLKISSTNVTR